jgi:hypothetical protein
MQGNPTRRHLGSRDVQRTEGELCIVVNRGRIRAAEGINRQQIFRCRNRMDPISAFAKNAGAPGQILKF